MNFYKTDRNLRCSIESIVDILADIGIEHKEELQCGIDHLKEINELWVFFKYEIKINRYPSYGETIYVDSEISDIYKCFTFRKYDMYDENKVKIIEAEAVICLIDTKLRKAKRVQKEQYTLFGIDEEMNGCNIKRLEELERVLGSKEFDIRYADIDFNNHVNNTNYIQWAIESTPIEVLNCFQLKDVVVDFEKECNYGSKVIVSYDIEENDKHEIQIRYGIKDNEENSIAKLAMTWTSKEHDF